MYCLVRHEENSAMLSYLLFVLCLIDDKGRHLVLMFIIISNVV